MSDLVVLWRVTEQCNFGCRFCGYDRSLQRPRRHADARTVIAFGHTLGAYRRQRERRVLVSWIGGEPLLWPPLAEVSASLHALGLDLSVTTNGWSLARNEIRRWLLEHYAELTVSVDGIGDSHDAVRGQPGSFEQLAASVPKLAAEKRAAGWGPVLRANVVLMRGNVQAFLPLCEMLAGWGIEEVTFNQLGGNDRPEFFPGNRLLPAQVSWLKEQLPSWREALAAKGLTLRGSDLYLARFDATSRDERITPRDCAPGSSFLFIDTTGRVSPCSFTVDPYGVPVQALDSPASIEDLPHRFAAARSARHAPACGNCHSTQFFGKFAVAS